MRNFTFKLFISSIAIFASLQAKAAAYDFIVDGIYYKIVGDTAVSVSYKSATYNSYSGDITIPTEVTYEDVTYPVTAIYQNAFRKSTGLTSVTIPSSITSIGNYAFRQCTGLTSVVIPEGVTTTGMCLFYDCTSLTSVSLPSTLSSVGISTFYNCSALDSITIPEAITAVRSSFFYGCSALASVTIPENITDIEDNAFCDCTSLSTVIINGAPDLSTTAFSGCSAISSVYSNVTTPGSIASTAFDTSTYSAAILYAPEGAKDTYLATSNWSLFTTIIEVESSVGITSLDTDDNAVISERFYNLSGVEVAEPSYSGNSLYIVVRTYGDGSVSRTKEIH